MHLVQEPKVRISLVQLTVATLMDLDLKQQPRPPGHRDQVGHHREDKVKFNELLLTKHMGTLLRTRQAARKRLNDVWARSRSASDRLY